jgi:hypothetical protein
MRNFPPLNSPAETIGLQSKLAASMTAESSKLIALIKLTEQTLAPLTARATRAVETCANAA